MRSSKGIFFYRTTVSSIAEAKTADLHPPTCARVCVNISLHPRVFCESENGCVRLSAPLARSLLPSPLVRSSSRHSLDLSAPLWDLAGFEHTREDFLQLTMQSRLHGNGPSGGDESNSHALLNVSAIKTRQAMVVANQQQQQQQHAQKQQSSHSVVLKVRPGGNNIHPSNQSVIVTRSSSPQRATPEGIAIGTLSTVVFHCNNDPMVSPEHGTLECTMKHGVWVYVDHSIHGTKLNNSRRIHKEAVVVRTGDRLLVGNTEVELHFETSSTIDEQRKDEAPSRHIGGRQLAQFQANAVNYNNTHSQTGIAPSPITFPAPSGENARSKLDQSKMERPKIDTSGASFSAATPLEYIASPIPVANQRRKRHSMTAFTPSPPGGGGGGFGTAGNPFIYQRTRPLVPSAPSTPPRLDATRPCTAANISPHQPQGIMKWRSKQSEGDNNSNNNNGGDEAGNNTSTGSRTTRPGRFTPPPPPPPLAYSSSPVTAPSLLQRVHLPQSPSPPLVPQQQQQHQRLHSGVPKSHRDNLRIQVSKKMAGYQAAAGGSGKSEGASGSGRPVPSGLKIPLPSTPPLAPSPSSSKQTSNQLDFTPPSSPVAHKDILRQKESLLNILKTKYKEEQLLKQQQEEWMRHNFSLATPPMSPIKSKNRRHRRQSTGSGDDSQDVTIEEDDDGEDMSDIEMPPRAPELLRTISLGIHQASPRLTAAVLASRARVNSFDDKRSNQRSPRTVNTNASQESVGFSSVSSSVSTELACHRRVTRSLSVSSSEDFISSSDINDFMGYEEEVGDDLTFTTHGFYSSDDCRSNPKDDSMRQFSSSSSYYNTSSSSSLRSATAATGGVASSSAAPYERRFSIDIVSSREPEEDDEENQQSPENVTHVMRKAESTPNLFDDRKRAFPSAFKSVVRRYHRVKEPSPIEVPTAMGSSPSVARRFRRLPSPV